MKQKPNPKKTEYSLEVKNRGYSHYSELFTEGHELGPFHNAQRVVGNILEDSFRRPLIDDDEIVILLRKRS